MGLMARLTKICWFDAPEYTTIVNDIVHLCKISVQHSVVALQFLVELVTEMNSNKAQKSLVKHRKTVVSFRDQCLLHIFKIALQSLRPFGVVGCTVGPVESKMREMSLRLALCCLSYDFMGTTIDDTCDDIGTVQVPSAWAGVLEDLTTVQLFVDVFVTSYASCGALVLETMSQLVSVRRSIFARPETRQMFLATVLKGLLGIMQAQLVRDPIPRWSHVARASLRAASSTSSAASSAARKRTIN